MSRNAFASVFALLVVFFFCAGGALAKEDRHVGYYYPKPANIETYTARAKVLEGMDRRKRIEFVVTMVGSMLERPYPLTAAVFVKGDQAEKLIIVSNVEGRLNTVYRARAMLATMTSSVRDTEIFKKYSVESYFTFLDLMKMLGFKKVTVSDGDTFTHQIIIK